MNVNGVPKELRGMSFQEIGEMLQEASPNKDGVGLRVELTQREDCVFEENFDTAVGRAICELISDAVITAGGKPRFQYNYCGRIFTTTPAS